jgi:hypothetical protein
MKADSVLLKRPSWAVVALTLFLVYSTVGVAQGPTYSRLETPQRAGSITDTFRQTLGETSQQNYRPRAWRKGAVMGSIVGGAFAVAMVTTCGPDGENCPNWGRAFGGLIVFTGIGALIGGLFPRD